MKTVTIEVENAYSKILEVLPYNVNFEISSVCSYVMEGAQFTAYGKSGWDGTKKLYDHKKQKFSTGLLNRVISVLVQHGFKVEFNDLRKKPKHGKEIPLKGDIILRDYQHDCVEALLKATRGCIQVSVGGGKTVISASIVGKYGLKSLIIVPTSALLYQTQKSIQKFLGVPVGVIGDSKVDIQNITVALFQACVESEVTTKNKLVKGKWTKVKSSKMSPRKDLLDYLKTVQLMIVDEGHRTNCKSVQEIFDACEEAYYRFACSGTICKDTEEDILTECVTGRILRDYRASELIKRGWIMQPTIHLISFKQPRWASQLDSKGEKIKGAKEYQLLYDERVTNNEKRNKIITQIAAEKARAGGTVLISIRFLEHGAILYEELVKEFGDKVQFVNGELVTDETQAAFDKLREKKLSICIASSLVNEGVDIPVLDTLIFAGCPKGKVNVMQVLGRVLRKAEGKDRADVYMIQDIGCKFLSDASKEREEILATEPEFIIKRC